MIDFNIISDAIEALDGFIKFYGARDADDNLLHAINQTPEIYAAVSSVATLRKLRADIPPIESAIKRASEMEKKYDKLTIEFGEKIEFAIKTTKEKAAKICEKEGEQIDSSWKNCAAAIRAMK